jgi:hypothetical protein
LPSIWPGNGSVLFNEDRGVGADFQIEKEKLSDLSQEDQEIVRSKWHAFVRTLPESLHESLLGKEFTTTTVRFRLLAIGGMSRKGISGKLSRQMEVAHKHKCVFCQKPGKLGAKGLQIDHKDWKKAFTCSSQLTIDDLQYACPGCNTRKRTALRKHFAGTRVLTPAELRWWYDPKASNAAQTTQNSLIIPTVNLAPGDATPGLNSSNRSGTAA